MPPVLLTAVALGSLGLANSASAQVTFTATNNPQANEQNVLLNTNTSGATVFGVTQGSGITVKFTSTSDTLTEPSNGQARIEATDGAVNNLAISVPGGTFTDLIGNPVGLNSLLTVDVNSTFGTQTFNVSPPPGNGQSFFTIIANSGTLINSVTLNSTSGFGDFRQPRISGAALNPAAVPEPSQSAALGLGMMGLAALALKARKRKSVSAV